MRICTFLTGFTAFFVLFCTSLSAQEQLLSENFDQCTLPIGWNVNINGNPNAVWYVSDSILNNDNTGQSMNGSCFLFIDDDATGDNTPSYVLDVLSPPFNTTQYPKIALTVDIHYRDWPQGNEKFEVLLTDGTNEYLVSRFDQTRSTGDSLGEIITVRYDLSLLAASPNARLIFRYDDAGGFNWWAGIDNVSVVGSGIGENVIAEPFNQCEKPSGWETEVLTGVDDWKFGIIDTGSAIYNGRTMDGTCFVYFDDDIIGNGAPYSIIRLKSPWFDGTEFANFSLFFDIILRYYSEKVAVYVQHGDGSEYFVRETDGDVGGPFFPNYVSAELDISPYRGKQMRVVFEYDDGKAWGWWAGLDNIKVTGSGVANDICTNAVALYSGMNCLPANTFNALFDGPASPCVARSVGGLWYHWTADFSGTARFKTTADFNDVVMVYSGDCNNLTPVLCNNDDEHGFTGETTYFTAQTGVQYLIQVSGREEGSFGKSRGNVCTHIEQVTAPPAAPANDLCSGAVALAINAAALPAMSNQNAGILTTQTPSLNGLARADIWYSFVAPTLALGQHLEIKSNANFSDILTLYSGTCNSLVEVAANHKGQSLILDNTVPGQTYLLQIAGTFASIEGTVAPQIIVQTENAPANDQCATAQNIQLGQPCVSGSNIGSTISGILPACVPQIGPDVWYQFTAPTSGAVRINSGAEFQHIVAIWKGDCGNLENIACFVNPLRCDGFLSLNALVPGQIYFVQIATRIGVTAPETGSFCLKITDGANPPDVLPLELKVIEKCVADNVSQLQITTNGGTAPYLFDGNQQGELVATGESYLTIVRDAAGCEKSVTGTAKPCQSTGCVLTGMLAGVDPTCFQAANGSLTPTVTGGIGPYTYQWSNGATTEAATALLAGVYSVTMTDALGCELNLSSALIEPLPLAAMPSNILQPAQGQSNGAVFIAVSGGTAPYSFNWLLNGQSFVTTQDLTNAPAGEYQLHITDANGCTASFDFTLQESVGSQEVSTMVYAEVFPNPAKEKAWLAVAFPTTRTVHVAIVDDGGRVLRTWTYRNVTEQNLPLDLKQLPSGNYQVVLRTDKEVLTEQLVIVK